jgi:serine/threonine protein kinase
MDKSQLVKEDDEALKQEIVLLKEIDHDRIVRLFDFFDEPEYYYLVTELMSGSDLLDRLTMVSKFSEAEAREGCKVLLDVLEYLSDLKIAHRDLKPENILIGSEKDHLSGIKLADFGFAKKVTTPNSLTTQCGSANYVAPEILAGTPYDKSCDMWSVGVIVYMLIAGYAPFADEEQAEQQAKIIKGDFEFHSEFWDHVGPEGKHFISTLLTVDPSQRLTAKAAKGHSWFKKEVLDQVKRVEDESKVFFMIGSQRSGSNWLRTMLEEREDLAGPHPPHIMREFMPIIGKFGDLSKIPKLKVLIDHVCAFVERNQVLWENRHGQLIAFERENIFVATMNSVERLSKKLTKPLSEGHYLLAIFDAIMNFYTKANGKWMWMCKSMGMSKFHDLLLEFYGEKRLRYIYLVRDPRDVAMSFMKT